eukprot:505335_1
MKNGLTKLVILDLLKMGRNMDTGKWCGRVVIGLVIWAGDCYEGSWKNNKRHGYGKYMYKSGDCYEGLYENGKRHGYGKYVWKGGIGNCYEGLWENGKKHGYGKYVWNDGDCYAVLYDV